MNSWYVPPDLAVFFLIGDDLREVPPAGSGRWCEARAAARSRSRKSGQSQPCVLFQSSACAWLGRELWQMQLRTAPTPIPGARAHARQRECQSSPAMKPVLETCDGALAGAERWLMPTPCLVLLESALTSFTDTR